MSQRQGLTLTLWWRHLELLALLTGGSGRPIAGNNRTHSSVRNLLECEPPLHRGDTAQRATKSVARGIVLSPET